MKILHLEDDDTDAALVRELLQGEWPDCDIAVTSTEQDFRAAVSRHDYDLILSDFSLVAFTGIEALKIAHLEAPDIPFIFLSGNIGEDRAIEALRAGAQDYVLKDRMKRLVTAIQRALRECTERRRLRQIEAERERLATILENTPDFVGISAPDTRVLYLNRSARQMLQLGEGPIPPGFTIVDYRPPEIVHSAVREHFATALRDGMWTGESVLLARDGRRIPVSQVIIAHRDSAGVVDYTSTVMRDLTSRKQVEALVNGQNQVLEMIAGGEGLTETLTALLQFIERQDDSLYCSILRLDNDCSCLHTVAAPRLPPAYLAAIDPVPVGPDSGSCGTAAYRRAPVITADVTTDPGWEKYYQIAVAHRLRACWSTPIFDTNHRLLGTLAVYRQTPGEPTAAHRQLIDIGTHIAAICISRVETERQLRDQADILNKASDAIVVTDMNERVSFWNQSCERTYGWTSAEAVGRELRELFPPSAVAELAAARKATEQSEEWRGELRLLDRHNHQVVMETRVTVIRDADGHPQGRLSISTDVTAKKKMEEQFFRAQRLESIGMLAAGIAHDLNNVLAPILLAVPLLRDRISDPSDLQILNTFERSAERGAALIRQILGFAHGADGDHRLIQAKHILRDIAAFVRETFPRSIDFHEEIPSELWPIKANPTQINQVLLNLCVNARDAMPHGGTLTLRGENVVLDEQTAGTIENARPGSFLVLHVQDSGTGIPPDVLPHIWEPFYTTKGTGKGTGLGLSTTRGIVESHAGFISLHSTVGQGTTFRVYLPVAEGGVPQASPGIDTHLIPRGHNETILVVDDEANIRNTCASMLTRHGYRVLTAGDGTEAIALFARRPNEIRVVVTDLSMPNLDGNALANIIVRLNPGIKIVVVSGHETGGSTDHPLPQSAHAFLVKPFRAEALLSTVHRLIQEPPTPPCLV